MTEQPGDYPPLVPAPRSLDAPAQQAPAARQAPAAPEPVASAAAVPPPAPGPAVAAGERHGFYLGLVSAAFPAILAGVRLFVLSNGDDATLKALAQHTSMQALLIGSYVTFLPLILILAAYLALSERRAAVRGAVVQPTVLASLPPPVALMLLVVGLLTAPVYLLLVLAAAAVLLSLMMLRRRGRPAPLRTNERPPSPLLGGRVPNRWVDALTLVLGVLLAGMVTLQGMWLPATALTVDGATKVAYILGQDEDLETVLYRDGGGPQQLESDQITSRRMCSEREAGVLRRPLAALIFPPDVKTSDVPLCRDLLRAGG